MAVSPHRRFPWRDNWKLHELDDEIRDWFYLKFLGKGRSLKLLILAAPQSAAQILRNACNWERQFQTGYLCPLKAVMVFSEQLDTVEGAMEVNALNRLHRYSQEYEVAAEGRWDPNAEIVKAQMAYLRSTVTRIRNKHEFLGLPEISFLDPSSHAGRRQILRAALHRIRDGRAPFDLILSGPFGRWIGRGPRLGAGEIAESYRGDQGRTRFRLRKVEIPGVGREFPTHCFGWGAHPIGPTGGPVNLAQYGGSQAFRRLVDNRCTHARVALMGLGPEMLDDPRLLSMQTPAEPLEIDYAPGRRSNETLHEECGYAVDLYYRMVDRWMFGSEDNSHHHDHLGVVIARHVVTMYHAWKNFGGIKRCIPKRRR